MRATREQEQMFAELGYEPIWAEDVREGDVLAVADWGGAVDFWVATNVRRSAPMYEHDDSFGTGRILNPDDPHYVYGWTGVRDDGTKTHCNYGRGFPLWRKP